MHCGLNEVFEKTVELFENDPRILAGWIFGSAGRNEEDEYSDVDPVFLVSDRDFEQVDRELTGIFRKICPNIALWWPESYNGSDIRNYAVLLQDRDDLFQYDMTLIRESDTPTGISQMFFKGCREENILFDKTGALKERFSKNLPQAYTTDRIVREIEKYWLFVFISVKYIRRSDVFKTIYARNELMQAHLKVLQMAAREGDWSWWPRSIGKNLDKNKQRDMLLYFGAPDMKSLSNGLLKQMKFFSEDAKKVCVENGTSYPQQLEEAIRRYVWKHLS